MAVSLAARSLLRHRVRTGLAMLGIVIGIAAVIVMVALGQGANAMVQAQISSMGRNLLMVRPGAASSGGGFSFGAGTGTTLTYDDGVALLREVPGLVAMTPVIRTRAQIVAGAANWNGSSIMGTNADFPRVRDWPLAEGEFFPERDVTAAGKVCVLGATVAEGLFPGDSAVGRTVRIKNIPFKITGVLARKGTSSMGFDQDDVVVAPWRSVRTLLEGRSLANVDQLLVATEAPELIPAVMSEIGVVLRARHRLADGQADDFNILPMSEMASTAEQTSETMSALLAGIASISLLVGGIGIMNIMLVSVTERTREIGLRLAVGARGRDILQQFLIEAVMLTSSAGVLGILLGAGAASLLANAKQWPLMLSPEVMGLAAAFSCVVGIFFGFYPALRAARLDPIEALRWE
ncbi:MAG: ABC transporter permease [Planctomycetota bacterium]